MPVISVLPRPARKGTRTKGGHRTYTQDFFVLTNNKYDGALTVRTDPRIPQIGSTYVGGTEADPTAFVTDINPVQHGEYPFAWVVSVEYSSRQNDGNTQDESGNPLNAPPERSMSFEAFTRIATHDIDGNPILNSAGEPYDPGVEVDDSRPIYQLTRRELSDPSAKALAYMDAVNGDVFKVAKPGQAKVKAITAVERRDRGKLFYEVSYEIAFRREGWQKVLLDQGYYEKIEGKLRVITDAYGVPLSKPSLLDGKGRKLQSGAKPVFKTWKTYKTLPFAALKL